MCGFCRLLFTKNMSTTNSVFRISSEYKVLAFMLKCDYIISRFINDQLENSKIAYEINRETLTHGGMCFAFY